MENQPKESRLEEFITDPKKALLLVKALRVYFDVDSTESRKSLCAEVINGYRCTSMPQRECVFCGIEPLIGQSLIVH